jgi:uncharacterized protein (TIGR03437 family)
MFDSHFRSWALSLILLSCFPYAANAQRLRVMNAASFLEDAPLSPGSIVSLFRPNLANTTAVATDPSNPPTTLGGVKVDVAGTPARLFYVTNNQINAALGTATPVGPATLTVTSPTGTFTAQVTIQAAAAPGVFSFSGAGTRDGAILNAVTFKQGPFSVTTGGQPTFLAIFTTGLDLSAAPTVSIDGNSVPVRFFGKAPCCEGLQQINIELTPELAGAGRVEITVTAKGGTSNVVEVVILPNKGQGSHAPKEDNQGRNREIAALAWVPGKSLALLTDENDDVVRVIDITARRVIKTIVLPEDAEPVAVAVNAAGDRAVVAERERGKVAIIDVPNAKVLGEVAVGGGPGSVAIAGNRAVVVNQDTDNVSIVNISAMTAGTPIAVGRGPRNVAVDAAANRAYVTNQGDGTISVIDLVSSTTLPKIMLAEDSRPHDIEVIPSLGLAVVTEPNSGPSGKVAVIRLTTGATTYINVNPDRSGGSSDIAVFGTKVYFANQSGGSVTLAPITMAGTQVNFTSTNIKAGTGARALAIDELDKLLLVTSQGSGNIVLIDLETNRIVDRINGVRSENEGEDDDHDNDDDREHAANVPQVTSLTPATAKAGTSFSLTIKGTNLTGTTEVAFLDPSNLPGNGNGRGRGNSGEHGPAGQKDPAFTTSNIQVNADGTQVTVNVQLAATATAGDRVVRVMTANGESSHTKSSSNTLVVTK